MDKKQLQEMREDFEKTGKLPPHLQKIVDAQDVHKKKMEKLTGHKITEVVIPGMEWMSKISMNEIKTDQQAAQELVKVAKSLVSFKWKSQYVENEWQDLIFEWTQTREGQKEMDPWTAAPDWNSLPSNLKREISDLGGDRREVNKWLGLVQSMVFYDRDSG